MTNLDNLYSQSYGFSCSHVLMWELDHKEGWASKNWCFRIVLEKTWESAVCTAQRSNQSILKEIKPEYSLEGLILKLKLLYFGYLMWRAESLEQTLILRKVEDKRRGQQRMRRLNSITNSMDVTLSTIWEIVKNRKAWCGAISGVAKSQTWLSDWTATTAKNMFSGLERVKLQCFQLLRDVEIYRCC